MVIDPDLDNLPKRTRWKLALLISALLAIAGLAVAAAIILFTGPTSLSPPPPYEPSPAPTSTTPSSTPSAEEDLFVAVMRERPAFQDESNSKLLDTGYAVCTAFNTGAHWNDIRKVIVSSGVSDYDAGWLVKASVETLCPNNRVNLPEE